MHFFQKIKCEGFYGILTSFFISKKIEASFAVDYFQRFIRAVVKDFGRFWSNPVFFGFWEIVSVYAGCGVVLRFFMWGKMG